MEQPHLPFWTFFHDIEKTLSYERWIDKYKQFLEVITGNHIYYDAGYAQFIGFCKALYLQDHKDEEKFVQLLRKAIEQEKEWLRGQLRKATEEKAVKEEQAAGSKTPPEKTDEPKKQEKDSNTGMPEKQQAEEPAAEEEKRNAGEVKPMYYMPSFEADGMEAAQEQAAVVSFLYNDEYYPVTRRQMVKGWQFLRRQEKGGTGRELDLQATIKQIARDGLFLEAKYKPGMRNREDAIVIFADYRGSMVAFHEMTDRLIATAKGEGGHPLAPVYYFQNYPAGFVYKRANLTAPVKIRQALAKANKNFTLAIVISDAGAARVGRDPQAGEDRVRKTDFLLKHLRDTCAHTIWLNPMPLHRWPGTAAEQIKKKVFLMAPLFEQGTYNFQDILRTILKQRHQTENKKQ